MNQLLLKIQSLPGLLLGFLVLIATLIGLYFYDPPTTLCKVQADDIQAKLVKGFFQSNNRGQRYKSGVNDAFQFCLDSNSSGGCSDIFARLNYFEKQIRNLASECRDDPATAFVRGALEKAFRLFTMIAWGDEPPPNKYQKVSWLSMRDLSLFCRLKKHYIRFYGRQTWQGYAQSYLPTLPGADKLPPQERWDLGLFSYRCVNLL